MPDDTEAAVERIMAIMQDEWIIHTHYAKADGWPKARQAIREELASARREAMNAGDDVAAALSAAMDSGEPIDSEGIDHCNYVISKWIEATGRLAEEAVLREAAK